MDDTRFRVEIPETDVLELKARLRAVRLADDFANADWRFGVERGWLKDMLAYWADDYDWRAEEAAINRLPHHRTEMDGLPIHYVYARGKGPRPLPIILTHGWPWTFWDWRNLIGPLSDPAAYGGDPDDAFDVIVPSLPGFGFSAPLRTADIGVRKIAGLWVRLMERLGHDRFMAAGGDWGSLVTAELGHAHPHRIAGVHLTLPMLPGVNRGTVQPTDFDASEHWMRDRNREAQAVSDGHILAHRRSAQTLAYAFEDSPAGLAAWIWERRRNWSDCDGDVERVFGRDFLCTTASLYWFTRTIGTSMRLYAAHGPERWAPLHDRERVIDVPTAFAVAPRELFLMPRQIAERKTNLVRWSVLPEGGHFLPSETPQQLVDEYRAFGKILR